ncbi:hypothetical protein IKF15_00755 [Candidatus Saccharibacteria bacterium]|nr:hypothetical protein [Candidatus Saccharibacteria bacterium]
MQWEFSLSSLFFGLLITGVGACLVIFYRQVADNFLHGVQDYDKTKLAGIIAIILGFLVMANLHYLILYNILVNVFPGLK